MFSIDLIGKLNELETLALDYYIKNLDTVQEMTIREYSDSVHISSTAIFRMTQKLGFKGWSDFKYFIKHKNDHALVSDSYYENLIPLDLFWEKLSKKSFYEALNEAVEIINHCNYLLFFGIGTSSSTAYYGTIYFNNEGINSFWISDIFRNVTAQQLRNTCVIVLSISGETPAVCTKVLEFKEAGAKIISITNNDNSTLSRLSDLNFSYQMPGKYAASNHRAALTTQLPVIALLEILAQHASRLDQNRIIR